MTRSIRRGRVAAHLSALLFLVVLAAISWGGWRGWNIRLSMLAPTVQAVEGAAYYWRLPATDTRWLELRDDTEVTPQRSRLVVLEGSRQIGPAHTLHAEIGASGKGRYSHWGQGAYFSASDNSDPRSNGRSYSVVYPIFLPGTAAWIAASIAAVVLWFELLAIRRWLMARIAHVPMVRRLGAVIANVIQSILIAIATVVVVVALAESWFRATRPFLKPEWPNRFDAGVGPHLVPGARVRWTNQLDFWNDATVNSLGFLDREPSPAVSASSNCNVTVLGDSFVEAAQVPISQKFHVVFEALAQKEMPERHIVTQAFGYSGTGQLNQLPFYQVYARPTHPRVVVLVFVGNDLANNSSVLEGMRNGWHPLHAPRLFARRDPKDQTVRILPISENWQAHLLTRRPVSPAPNSWSDIHGWLRDNSYFYGWIWANLKLRYPKIADRLEPGIDVDRVYTDYMREIATISGFERSFDGWAYPRDLDMDSMFDAEGKLPPVFEEAWQYTAFALDAFRAEAARDGSTVVALLSTSVATGLLHPDHNGPRLRRYHGALLKLMSLLEARGIPYTDQQAYIDAHGVAADEMRFVHDRHWSPKGHRYAAESLLRLFKQHPELCKP